MSTTLPNLSQLHINALCKRARPPYYLLDYHRSIASALAKDDWLHSADTEAARTTDTSKPSRVEATSDNRAQLFSKFQEKIPVVLNRLQATQFKANSTVLSEAQLIRVLENDLLNRRWVVVFRNNQDNTPIMRWLIFVLDHKKDLHAFVYNHTNASSASTELGTWKPRGYDQFTEFFKDRGALLFYDSSERLELIPNEVFDKPKKRRTAGGRVFTDGAKPNPFTEWQQAVANAELLEQPSDDQTSQPSLNSEEWSLRKEYEAHLAWLRMLQAPLDLDTPNEIKHDSFDLPLRTPLPTELQFVKDDLQEAMRELKLFKIPAWREWFNNARIMLDSRRLEFDCADALQLDNQALVQPSFPALGAVQDDRAATRSSATKNTIQLWKDMIGAVYDSAYYTNDRLVPLYSVSMPSKTSDVTESSTSVFEASTPLQVEHIVPQSWLHATSSLCGFEYATDDPLLCFMTTKSNNEARGARPLQFGRGLNVPGTYAVPLRSQQAFLARVNAYAALTYPLLGPYSEATMGRSTTVGANVGANMGAKADYFTQSILHTETNPYDCSYTPVLPSVTSRSPINDLGPQTPQSAHAPLLLGIVQYAQQWDALMILLAHPPDPWERILSHMCYVQHRRRNPLMHSPRARQALTTPSHPWNALLRRRWDGLDLTSRAML